MDTKELKQQILEEFEIRMHRPIRDNGSLSDSKEGYLSFVSQSLNRIEAQTRIDLLNKLAEELNFHHVAKRNYSSGSWDDGVHHAVDLVERELVHQIKELKKKYSLEEKEE